MKYINEVIINTKKSSKINLMPGTGAGSLDSAIRLYLAWGRNFIVILDSDEGGKTQKNRYLNNFGILIENKIFSLEDIDSNWKKTALEKLFTETEILEIQKESYPLSAKYNKTHFNRAIQEAFLNNKTFKLSKTTRSNFEKIIEFCVTKL